MLAAIGLTEIKLDAHIHELPPTICFPISVLTLMIPQHLIHHQANFFLLQYHLTNNLTNHNIYDQIPEKQ